jgi:C1q domain-containing protein
VAHSTTPNLQPQDFFSTTLNANVGASDTVINLVAVPTASEGYLVLDPNNISTREVIYYNSKGSGTVTCPDASAGSGRGIGGTSVQAHTAGVLVEMREVAEYWLALQNGDSLGAGSVGTSNLETGIEPATVAENPYKFFAYMGNATSANASLAALVKFDTEVYDTGSHYSTSTGLFTAPLAGYYKFEGSLSTDTSSPDSFGAWIYKNGGAHLYLGNYTYPTGLSSTDIGVNFTTPRLSLAQNDTIAVWARNTNATNTWEHGSSPYQTWFSGGLESAT